MRVLLLALLVISAMSAGIVEDVRTAIAANDLAGADRQVQAYRQARGATADLAAAIGWQGRAALTAKNLDRAGEYAYEGRQMTLPNLWGPGAGSGGGLGRLWGGRSAAGRGDSWRPPGRGPLSST